METPLQVPSQLCEHCPGGHCVGLQSQLLDGLKLLERRTPKGVRGDELIEALQVHLVARDGNSLREANSFNCIYRSCGGKAKRRTGRNPDGHRTNWLPSLTPT